MKRHSETTVVITHYGFCERCNHKWVTGSADAVSLSVEVCPAHGEWCCYCTDDPEKISFPLQICPDCKITWKEAMYRQRKKGRITGPNYNMDKGMDLPEPFIVLRNDTTGWWIGSKKEVKA